jgi:methionyl-tRNA formyltransferase
MKIAFAGTPEFARRALEAIVAAGHEVVLVLSQPDRPAGRGMKLQASPVKELAVGQRLPLAQPRSLRLDGKYPDEARAAEAALRAAQPQVMVVAAYGLMLPHWALALPVEGCLNIHGSLLPRWRGAAPIQRAIEAGDTATGITIMRMDAGLDTGPMLLEESLPIAADETAATLHDRLASLGAKLVVQALRQLPELAARAQPAEGVTYAKKIEKSEAALDWQQPAASIERRLRAFDPFPGCTAVIQGQLLKIWRGRVVETAHPAPPGTVADAGAGRLIVGCGGGSALEILEVQAPGGRRVTARDWLARASAKPS